MHKTKSSTAEEREQRTGSTNNQKLNRQKLYINELEKRQKYCTG